MDTSLAYAALQGNIAQPAPQPVPEPEHDLVTCDACGSTWFDRARCRQWWFCRAKLVLRCSTCHKRSLFPLGVVQKVTTGYGYHSLKWREK